MNKMIQGEAIQGIVAVLSDDNAGIGGGDEITGGVVTKGGDSRIRAIELGHLIVFIVGVLGGQTALDFLRTTARR